MVVTDYFAELYVVGRFADKGWNVYLPHRDKGFDFIVSKQTEVGDYVIRPVQLKGKYPTASKRNWPVYGYTERLSTLHPEMVLAIPYFAHGETSGPVCVAYMPRTLVRKHSRGYRCQPAVFRDGTPIPRRDHAKFLDAGGLELLEAPGWKASTV